MMICADFAAQEWGQKPASEFKFSLHASGLLPEKLKAFIDKEMTGLANTPSMDPLIEVLRKIKDGQKAAE